MSVRQADAAPVSDAEATGAAGAAGAAEVAEVAVAGTESVAVAGAEAVAAAGAAACEGAAAVAVAAAGEAAGEGAVAVAGAAAAVGAVAGEKEAPGAAASEGAVASKVVTAGAVGEGAAAGAASGAAEGAASGEPQVAGGPESDAGDAGDLTAAAAAAAWRQREAELLQKIRELQDAGSGTDVERLKMALKLREDEVCLLRARVTSLEAELQPRAGRNHDIIASVKQQHEELLSKAKGMIFDKTKVVKNQELQIEALATQVASLKDINAITKDLLEIRNSEVKAMEDRLQAMEARFTAERMRHELVARKAETSTSLNEDLKKEYVTQLALFKELRGKYEERVDALVSENTRLKELRAAAAEQKELQK